MHPKVIAATVVALLAAVPAAAAHSTGSAAAPATKPPPALLWAPGYQIGYTETVSDAAGHIVSQTHRDGIPAGQAFGTATVAGSELQFATSVDPGSNLAAAALAASAPTRRLSGCCSSSGSDTVQFTVTKYTLLGNVAWRYYQVNHFCWQYPNITCVSVGSGFSNVDSQQTVNYGDHGYGWYYTWSGGPFGGHFAHRDGSVSNCILKYGCISTSYPYVEMWLNGNGAWTARGGGN